MNYSEIKYCDIANGNGVRTSLFVSGCRRHCKGCFNESAWDFDAGKPFTAEVEDAIIRSLDSKYVDGISVLGGEPLEPENVPTVGHLLAKVKDELPGKDVWMWTGNTYEQVKHMLILQYVDVLVDGAFVEELKDITLRFRGLDNQRIIALNKTRETGSLVLWDDGESRAWKPSKNQNHNIALSQT